MNKASVVLLITLFLFSNTEFHELLKAPVLIEHYLEHKSETPEMTILGFLALHYSNSQTQDDDYSRDSRLPFKTTEHLPVSVTGYILHYAVKLPVADFYTDQKRSFYSASFISFQLLSSIWQPPKC